MAVCPREPDGDQAGGELRWRTVRPSRECGPWPTWQVGRRALV
jgi:hypothetical protein